MQMDQGGWSAPQQGPTTANTSAWGGGADPWASSGAFGGSPPAVVATKKEERDPFANIWQ